MSSVQEQPMTSPRGVVRQWRACAAAFTFLTRIPSSWLPAHDADDLASAVTYFPLVGLVVAGIGSAVYVGSLYVWPVSVAIVLSIAAMVWITGAFHEDALADAFDGFGGGWEAPQVLAIMKDSRVGSYALIGVLLVMLGKMTAVWAIADRPLDSVWQVCAALVAAHVLGRWSSVVLMFGQSYVRPDDVNARVSAGRTAMHAVTRTQLFAATVLAALIVACVLGVRMIPVMVVAWAVTWCAGRYFRRRIGGVTGDALGAANQIVELCVYLALAAHLTPW